MVTFPMIPSPLCQEDRIRKTEDKKATLQLSERIPATGTSPCNSNLWSSFCKGLCDQFSHRFKKTHSFSSSTPVARRCQKTPYLLILLYPLKTFPKLNINQPTIKKKYSPIYEKNILTNAAKMYIALFLARQNLYGVEILAVIRGSISSHRSV